MAAHPQVRTDLPDPAPLYRQRTPGGRGSSCPPNGAERAIRHHPHHHQEALSSLEADGLIYRAERRGWFVAPPLASPTIPPSTPTFTSGLEQQRTAETRVLAHGNQLASSELCRWMGLEPFTPLYEIRRQRLIDDRARAPRQPSPAGEPLPRHRQRSLKPAPHRAFTGSAMA